MIKVTSQIIIEQAFRKENSKRFILFYSSPLSQLNNVHDLGYSGEGKLSRIILWNNADILSSDGHLKDLMKLFHNSTHTRMHTFVYA